MKNLKVLSFFLVSSLFVGTTIADDHAEAGPFYAFYHLQTANPAAVVAAMDKFWASDCGKKYPADVALSEEVFNGGNASTHFIINTFQNAEDQAAAAEIMRSCPDALTFLSEFYSDAQATSQYMGPAAIDENDWTQGPGQIAPIVAWLCTDAAKDVTSQIIHSQGGILGIMQQPAIIQSFTTDDLWTLDQLDKLIPELVETKKFHDEEVAEKGAPKKV